MSSYFFNQDGIIFKSTTCPLKRNESVKLSRREMIVATSECRSGRQKHDAGHDETIHDTVT